MKRHFNRHIEGIDLDFWHELIDSHGELLTLNKGEAVCRFKMPTHVIGYVKSGYLKYTIEGSDKIGGFAFPGALFGDYPNCMYNHQAQFDIIAGRKSDLMVMDATILYSICEESPESFRHLYKFAESAYNSLIDRYCTFIAGGPMERYLCLIKEHPQIEQDISQKEIAEFLQITPTHLSRIRKELLSQ